MQRGRRGVGWRCTDACAPRRPRTASDNSAGTSRPGRGMTLRTRKSEHDHRDRGGPGATATGPAPELAFGRVRGGRRRPAPPPGIRWGAAGRHAARAGVLPAHHPLRLSRRPGHRPGHLSGPVEHQLADHGGLRSRLARRDMRGGGRRGGRAPLGGRAGHRAERGGGRRRERSPGGVARRPRRPAGRGRDRRLSAELPGAADRLVHGGGHGGAPVPGPGRAAAD